MRHVRGGDGLDELEAMQVVNPLEKPFTAAEESGDLVNAHLVYETGLEILPADLGAASERDVLVPRGAARLLERRLDPVRHEVEGRAAFHRERRALVVREHENRVMEGRVLPPPAPPRLLGVPSAGMTPEHVAPHDRRADVRGLGLDHPRTLVVLAAGLAMCGPPDAKGHDPLMEPLATDAERLLQALAGSGSIAVERHREIRRRSLDTSRSPGNGRSPQPHLPCHSSGGSD